jgi:hypothetical protein
MDLRACRTCGHLGQCCEMFQAVIASTMTTGSQSQIPVERPCTYDVYQWPKSLSVSVARVTIIYGRNSLLVCKVSSLLQNLNLSIITEPGATSVIGDPNQLRMQGNRQFFAGAFFDLPNFLRRIGHEISYAKHVT